MFERISDFSKIAGEKIESNRLLRKTVLYVIFFIIAFFFMLFFALWESPFYKNWYGCDASFFSMVGRGINMGLVPYKDFWDLKGPYFFFLQALGQFIHKDRLGVFLLEVPFLFFSITIIYELGRLYISRIKSVVVVSIFLLGHISTLWGGNTLEELFLPFSLMCLYLTVKHLRRGGGLQNLPRLTSVFIGLSVGVIAFAKITVGAPIFGICIAIMLVCILEKDLKSFFKIVLYALMGFLIAIAPVFIYFGYHGNIQEMLYAVFVFAFKRSIDGEAFNITWELKLFGTYVAFFFAIVHKRELNRDLRMILIAMSVVIYFLLHLGNPFIYYFTTTYPPLVLSIILFLYIYNPLIVFTRVKQAVIVLMFMVFLYYYTDFSMDTVHCVLYDRGNTWHQYYYEQAHELASLIPEWERNRVFSFSTDMTWFEANQIMPCYKYQVNLQFFIALDNRIQDNILEYFDKTPSKWLVVGPSFSDEIPILYSEIVEKKYDLISSNDTGQLYLLKDKYLLE